MLGWLKKRTRSLKPVDYIFALLVLAGLIILINIFHSPPQGSSDGPSKLRTSIHDTLTSIEEVRGLSTDHLSVFIDIQILQTSLESSTNTYKDYYKNASSKEKSQPTGQQLDVVIKATDRSIAKFTVAHNHYRKLLEYFPQQDLGTKKPSANSNELIQRIDTATRSLDLVSKGLDIQTQKPLDGVSSGFLSNETKDTIRQTITCLESLKLLTDDDTAFASKLRQCSESYDKTRSSAASDIISTLNDDSTNKLIDGLGKLLLQPTL